VRLRSNALFRELEQSSRYALKVKNLPFETIWVEGPDIAKTVIDIGGKPTGKKPDGSPLYTLPVIHDRNTSSIVSDSFEIARYLDKAYAETPSLLLGIPTLHKGFTQAFDAAVFPALALLMFTPMLPKLNEPSQKHWAHEEEEFPYPKGEKLVETLKQLEAGLAKVASWHDDGQIIVGSESPIFVDAYIAGHMSILRWVHGEDGDIWKHVMRFQDGRWVKFMEKMREYE
jgi:glutathione S-transferase